MYEYIKVLSLVRHSNYTDSEIEKRLKQLAIIEQNLLKELKPV